MAAPRSHVHSVSFLSKSEAQTGAFATHLGARLVPGDALLLSGEIGAGKSVFARAIIQRRLAEEARFEDVPSPTYTLVQTYELSGVEIWHADLYRLGDVSEVAELGLQEAFDSAISIIEWAEKLKNEAPENALHLTLSATEHPGERLIELSWSDPKWDARLEGLREVA